MIAYIKRAFNRLVRKSTYIHQQPVNKVSIFILIFIDIFVLINVFSGLENISALPLMPSEELPCFVPYDQYQTSKKKDTFEFDAENIENKIEQYKLSPSYATAPSIRRLGEVSTLCQQYPLLEKALNTKDNIKLKNSINQDRDKISSLNQENQIYKRQYDSTLLEKIAGQSGQKSINNIPSNQVKSKIDTNNAAIKQRKQQIKEKQNQLIQSPAAVAYLKFLNDTQNYANVKSAHQSAEFWYPNKQLLLQILFLLPLILIAYFWHNLSAQKNRGLQSLLSWHLLLIFCVPLIFKFFEFIQFGNIVRIVLDWLSAILGGLLFVASYGLILLIPLLGFGLIKFLQVFVLNPRVQAKNRIQKAHCISCNSKLRLDDEFCPHCGFNQYQECQTCHTKTYQLATFCKSCGDQLQHR